MNYQPETGMQWLIDIIKEWHDGWFADHGGYHNRQAPYKHDFKVTDFTWDGEWHDLDLSSIVPEGAKAANLHATFHHSDIAVIGYFRSKDVINIHATCQARPQIANHFNCFRRAVGLDANRVIQYMFTTGPWDEFLMSVKGWWF